MTNRKTTQAAYRAKHREKLTAYSRAYYLTHKEEQAEYRAQNQAKRKIYNSAYYAKHREKRDATHKSYIASLPAITYRWIAPDGHCAYVGRGTSQRPRKHKRATWWTPKHTLITKQWPSEAHAMRAEGDWIIRYKPKHNIEGYRR